MDAGFYESLAAHPLNVTHVPAGVHGDVHRLLAAAGKPTADYGVISIVILTLALVLVIETCRHKLDARASGHPFFHTVLHMMYQVRS